MVVLQFTPTEFFDYLTNEGAKKIADYPDEDIVVYEFQDQKIPLQIRSSYYPCYVVKIYEAFKIPSPPDFKKVSLQIEEARNHKRRKQG